MKSKRLISGVIFALTLLSYCVPGSAEAGFLLVTPEEYARDQASKIRYKALAVSEPGAPTIEIVEPRERDKIEVPIKIHIKFIAEDGASIVVDTIRILYGWLGIDITERIREHAIITATGIKADNAELPVGSHRITIKVADTKHRQAESTFRIRVAGRPSTDIDTLLNE